MWQAQTQSVLYSFIATCVHRIACYCSGNDILGMCGKPINSAVQADAKPARSLHQVITSALQVCQHVAGECTMLLCVASVRSIIPSAMETQFQTHGQHDHNTGAAATNKQFFSSTNSTRVLAQECLVCGRQRFSHRAASRIPTTIHTRTHCRDKP